MFDNDDLHSPYAIFAVMWIIMIVTKVIPIPVVARCIIIGACMAYVLLRGNILTRKSKDKAKPILTTIFVEVWGVYAMSSVINYPFLKNPSWDLFNW